MATAPKSAAGETARLAGPARAAARLGHAQSRAIGRNPDIERDRAGVAAVEFALLAPLLFLLLLGMCQFGLTLNQYLTLTNATRAGARQLAISRGDATPRTDTLNRIYGSVPNLTQASLTITLSVNGAVCATDTACGTALVAGLPATVKVSYPCSLAFFGYNFAPVCSLTSQTTERVE